MNPLNVHNSFKFQQKDKKRGYFYENIKITFGGDKLEITKNCH